MRSQLRHAVGSAGVNRGALVRALARLGTTRLHGLVERSRGAGPGAVALRVPLGWVSQGSLVVTTGIAEGLRLSMGDVSLLHAHLGLMANGNLEPGVQEAMRRHLRQGDVVWDVGANVGFFSLVGSRLVGEAGHVYAVEPAPDNVLAIRANAALNGFANVTAVPVAASAEAGTARLQVTHDQSWSRLAEYGAHEQTDAVVDVEVSSVDALVASGLRPPDLVKIDVEGAELAVLEGMRRTIADHRPVIVCELHGAQPGVVSLLRDAGYRLVNLDGPGAIEEAGPSAHLLALPAGDPGD